MQTQRAESGQRIFIPENVVEFRGMATGMNIFVEEAGLLPSQRAKYDLPDWALVGAFIPGADRSERAVTPQDISEKLLEHNIRRSRHKVSQIIGRMIHLKQSIHPHRRSIGQACFQFVQKAGGIEFNIQPPTPVRPWAVCSYYFGKPHEIVLELRKQYGISVRG